MTEALPGHCSGDPKIGTDGKYIYINSNSDAGSSGHFNLISTNGTVLFTSENDDATDFPFGPVGCYNKPIQGAYAGGEANWNDICVWGSTLLPDTASVYFGATYAFQMSFDQTAPFAIRPLLPNDSRGLAGPEWQVVSAPLLTNEGLDAYWSVSRGQFRAWVGAPGQEGTYFDRRAVVSQKSFPSAQPRFIPNKNTLVKTSASPPQLFAGLASQNFVSMDFELNEVWVNPTVSLVLAEARVSPDNERIYYTQQAGDITSANTADGEINWAVSIGSFTMSEFSMSPDGGTLYLGTTQGKIVAWDVGLPPPSEAPSEVPSDVPSAAPSRGPSPPTLFPSFAPSDKSEAPSLAPTGARSDLPVPTDAPVVPPPDAPVKAPTDTPVQLPTEAPTPTSGAFSIPVFSVLAGSIAAVLFL